MNADLLETAKALPVAERVELLDALWESLLHDGFEPTLSPAQSVELDRRLEAHRKDPADVVAWEQIKSEAEARLNRGS